MLFSINAYKLLLGMDDTCRLCRDNTWKTQLDFYAFDPETDLLFESFDAANRWLKTNNPISVNGEVVDLNEQLSDFVNDNYNIEIVVHRITKPVNPIFTKDQLRRVLLNGDDRYTNSLVIDYEGNLKLVSLVNKTALTVTEYPVRLESFQAGNGYVGSEKGLSHLDKTYMVLLEAWQLHIYTGRSIFQELDSEVELSEEQLKTKIMETVGSLK